MKKLIIEEDSVYEIDEECFRKKEKESKEILQKDKMEKNRKRKRYGFHSES